MTGPPSAWHPAEIELVRLLDESSRGPRRGGIFALWLTVRVALMHCGPESAVTRRARRRHVAALERRLSSLTIQPSLRRALKGALADLLDEGAGPAGALRQLVVPAAEALGAGVGEVVAQAWQEARQATDQPS